MYGPIILADSFVSTGEAKVITMRSDFDWFNLYNYTRIAAGGANTVVQAYWQRGMADGAGIGYTKLAAGNSMVPAAIAAPDGFTLVDTSNEADRYGARRAVTNVNGLVVATANTNGLYDGDVIRFDSIINAEQLNGISYTIDTITPGVSFQLSYSPNIANTAITGNYRKVNYIDLNYPNPRYISAITQAAQAVVTFTMTHTFKVGEQIRFNAPVSATGYPVYGMQQIYGKTATITAIDAVNNTVTIDLDTTAYDAFVFPTAITAALAGAYTPAQAVAVSTVGTNQAVVNPFNNGNIIGMYLGEDVYGTADDVIYWTAGKAFGM